jgi:2-methylcitrate dehydratase PrpD
MGLSEQQAVCAMGVAGSQATGIQEFINDGTWVKRFHPGWAAHGGIVAAEMASNGFTAPARVLEGRYGLYNVLLGPDRFDPQALTAGLGTTWHTREITFKPYPCCHLLHAFIDAAIAIKRQHRLSVDDIEAIEARIPVTPQHLLCEPLDAKYAPLTTYQAMFSLPYAIAVALIDEKAGLRQFSEERIRDPHVLALARRVTWTDDPESLYPRYFSGFVKVRTRDGRTFEHRESYNRGCPENPLAYDDLLAKFRDNAEPVLGAEKAATVIRLVEQLDTLSDLRTLGQALSRG